MEVPDSMTGKLIIGFHKIASTRWKLQNYDLSTTVHKAVGTSNLNHDFRLRAVGKTGLGDQEGKKNEWSLAEGR